MTILDDMSPYHGLPIDHASRSRRLTSARRTAVTALALALLWGLGFLSLVALLIGFGAWSYLRSNDDSPAYARVALAGVALGVVGLGVAVALTTA